MASKPSPPSRHDPEPVYGDVYLPRKFKISVAWPGDNSVDLFAQDVGIVPTLKRRPHRRADRLHGVRRRRARDDPRPRGRHLPAAGQAPSGGWRRTGSSMSSRRSSDAAGFGDREGRHRARSSTGRPARHRVDPDGSAPAGRRGSASRSNCRVDGRGAPSQRQRHRPARASARLADRDEVGLRTAIRSVSAGLVTSCGSRPPDLCFGIAPDGSPRSRTGCGARRPARGDVTALRRLAIACPALPTCGQALGEAERVLPDLVDEVERCSPTAATVTPIRVNRPDARTGGRAVHGRDRDRRADEDDVRRLRRRVADGGAAGRADPGRRAAGPDPRRARARARPLRRRPAAGWSATGERRPGPGRWRRRSGSPSSAADPLHGPNLAGEPALGGDRRSREDPAQMPRWRREVGRARRSRPGNPELLTVQAARVWRRRTSSSTTRWSGPACSIWSLRGPSGSTSASDPDARCQE